MKRIPIALFLAILSASCLFAQEKTDGSGNLKFLEKRIVQCGDVKAGTVIDKTVAFENDSESPLTIYATYTTCNCTSAETDKKFYGAHEKGFIRIVMDTKGKYGPETSVIRIQNSSSSQCHIVRIDLNIVK